METVIKKFKHFQEAAEALAVEDQVTFERIFDLSPINLEDDVNTKYNARITEDLELVDGCYPATVELTISDVTELENTITFSKDYKSFNEAMQSLTADGKTLFLGFPDGADPDEYMPKLVIDVKEELVDGFWPATATFTYAKIK